MDPQLNAATALTLTALIGHIITAPDDDPPRREDHISPHEEKIAEEAGVMPLRYYGWILYELAGRPIRIDIIREGSYYRLAETEMPHAVTYGRSWLYPRYAGLRPVIDAARTWGGSADSEPEGWTYRNRIGPRIME